MIFSGHEVANPEALRGDVIYHRIKHKAVVFGQSFDVVPVPQSRIHQAVVDDAKSVVGRIRKVGQEMQAGHPGESLFHEREKSVQWGAQGRLNLIAVSDEQDLTLVGGETTRLAAELGILPGEIFGQFL